MAGLLHGRRYLFVFCGNHDYSLIPAEQVAWVGWIQAGGQMKEGVFIGLVGLAIAGMMAGCEKGGGGGSDPPSPTPTAQTEAAWTPFIGHWKATITPDEEGHDTQLNLYVTDQGTVQLTESYLGEESVGVKRFKLNQWIGYRTDYTEYDVMFKDNGTVWADLGSYGLVQFTRHCANTKPNL